MKKSIQHENALFVVSSKCAGFEILAQPAKLWTTPTFCHPEQFPVEVGLFTNHFVKGQRDIPMQL